MCGEEGRRQWRDVVIKQSKSQKIKKSKNQIAMTPNHVTTLSPTSTAVSQAAEIQFYYSSLAMRHKGWSLSSSSTLDGGEERDGATSRQGVSRSVLSRHMMRHVTSCGRIKFGNIYIYHTLADFLPCPLTAHVMQGICLLSPK
jgi:hypothetical protein